MARRKTDKYNDPDYVENKIAEFAAIIEARERAKAEEIKKRVAIVDNFPFWLKVGAKMVRFCGHIITVTNIDMNTFQVDIQAISADDRNADVWTYGKGIVHQLDMSIEEMIDEVENCGYMCVVGYEPEKYKNGIVFNDIDHEVHCPEFLAEVAKRRAQARVLADNLAKGV